MDISEPKMSSVCHLQNYPLNALSFLKTNGRSDRIQ